VAVLALRTGEFGLLDVRNVRRRSAQRLECELTLRAGEVVWDRNGRAGEIDARYSNDGPTAAGSNASLSQEKKSCP
jgi:hypothetical protein